MSTATLAPVRPSSPARTAARPVMPPVGPAPSRPVLRAVGPRPTGGLVLTRRGRRLVRLLVLSLVTLVLATVLVLAWVGIAATVAPGASAGDGRAGVVSGAERVPDAGAAVSVVVAPGDTLWQLAREHAPDRDPRSVVADIVALNELGSTGVQAGARVLVPVG